MSDSEIIEKLIEYNTKSIQALTDLTNIIVPRIDEMQRQVANMQRQMIDNQRSKDENRADIRKLILENQRILKKLESRN